MSSLSQLSRLAALQIPIPVMNDQEKNKILKTEEIEKVGEKRPLAPPSAGSPPNGVSCVAPPRSDWARQVSVEERNYIREKIKLAYTKKTNNSYEDLLTLCSAIEEELVLHSAPSRLDYFAITLQYEKKITEKKNQFEGTIKTPSFESMEVAAPSPAPPTRHLKSTICNKEE